MTFWTTNSVAHLLTLTLFIASFVVAPAQSENLAVVNAHLAPWVGKHLDDKTPCKSTAYIPGGGPFDYLQQQKNAGRLNMVENAHFPPDVENLVKGKTGPLMADIDFVLRAFPNHHRALNSAMEYSLRYDKWPKDHPGLPAECYLQRAINFRPADGVPYRLFGFYLQKKGKFEEALESNELALRFFPKDVMVRYNTGLILVELERYEEALAYARPLYEAGLTLPGLKNKLKRAGHWEPTEKEKAAYAAFLKASAQAAEAEGSSDSSLVSSMEDASAEAADSQTNPASVQSKVTADADPEPGADE